MRIALFGLNSATSFSGGRYHAWMMAEALAYAGHDVCYVTNNRPFFYDDFASFPRHRDVELHISPDLRAELPEGSFDVVFMVPHSTAGMSPFLSAALFGRERGARLALLNFESANWFNALAPEPRPIRQWRGWLRFSRGASLILSSAAESDRYAREFYGGVAPEALFTHCYPSINTLVADRVPDRPAEKRISVITRFGGSPHKGGWNLPHLLSDAMRGYTLVLTLGLGDVPRPLLTELQTRADRHGVKLEIQRRVTDEEKFEHLKRCRLMLFPSFFEGFGLPPVEAQYCNVPCVAFELPVLREVSGDGIYYVERGDWDAFRERIAQVLAADRPHTHLREQIADVARFESFSRRIDHVMHRAMGRPITQPAGGLLARKLELAAHRSPERLLRLIKGAVKRTLGIRKSTIGRPCP